MLAAEAAVAASTASAHLTRLTQAGLVAVHPRGRYRYYALAGPAVAEMLEQLMRVAPKEQVTSLRASTRAAALRRGRSCYNPLAGRLGVDIASGLQDAGWIDGLPTDEWSPPLPSRAAGAVDGIAAVLTPNGRRGLAALGVALPSSDGVRCCIDWTEQRPHVAGRHGQAMLERLLELDWVRRVPPGRVVRLTDRGRRGLRDALGCDLESG
jgi:hypothetical protein